MEQQPTDQPNERTDDPDRSVGVVVRRIGGAIGVLLLVAIAAFSIARGSADDANHLSVRDANARPSAGHHLGADAAGRDRVARVAHATRQTARVSAIAVGLIGGFAVVIGLLGALVRRALPDTVRVRWAVGIVAGLAWLTFVRWLWHLPVVTEVGDDTLSGRAVHAVHDATLALASGRLFAATCIGVASALALGALRIGPGQTGRTVRHLVGAAALLFGLGCASLEVVDPMAMIGLTRPDGGLAAQFSDELVSIRAGWWVAWPSLAMIGLILVACALVGGWLLTDRRVAGGVDAAPRTFHHPAAITLASIGVGLALARQLLLPTIVSSTATGLQLAAAACVVVATVLLVVGRTTKGARAVDLGTATWFVVGATVAILLHWPAQHHLDHAIADDLQDHRGVLGLLEHEPQH
ncbi:MAG: hypothetical protein JWM98_692 [Thermoleophilia bacterium]|nr:hypothetical protein [Thermoleophilia bacterium]